MTLLPPSPWHTVHIDICRPFPTGEYLLVIDAYSRFPEVNIVLSTTAKGKILKLECIFATHGIPVIKSDNGLPFQSCEFETYMIEMEITHQQITPLCQQANSEGEKFMKPLMKTIRAAHIEQKHWRRVL